MKKHVALIFIITLPLLTSAAQAVTYVFPDFDSCRMQNETVIKPGSKIYLFHSGTADVRRAIKVSDVLKVYREYPSGFPWEVKEIGKVRILENAGEHYFKGEVIEGEVEPGFLAKKGRVSCFITSFISNTHCRNR